MSKIKKYHYLLTAVLLFVLAQGVFILNIGFSNTEPNKHNFEVKLTQKEQLADKYIDTLLNRVKTNKLAQYVNEYNKDLDWLYQEHGIIFSVTMDDELLFWTGNSLVFPKHLPNTNAGIVQIENAFVEARSKQIEDIQVTALIILKYNYPYENEYLNNNFHHSFGIKKQFNIGNDYNSEHAIFSKDGEFILSLEHNLQISKDKTNHLSLILFIIGLISLLIFLRNSFARKPFSHKQYLIFIAVLFIIRFIMQFYQLPNFIYCYPIFNSLQFKTFLFFPSLGDLLISVIFSVFAIFVYYINAKGLANLFSTKYWRWGFLVIRLLIITAYSGAAIIIFHNLIDNPNIQLEAYDVLNLSFNSFIGYFELMLLYIGLILLIDKAAIQSRKLFSRKEILLGGTFILALILTITSLIFKSSEILPIFFLLVIFVFWNQIRFNSKPGLGAILAIIVFFSLFATGLIRNKNYQHRIVESKAMAFNLAREQDPVIEEILADQIPDIALDSNVIAYLQDDWFKYDDFVKYLRKQYFSGYLTGYDFQLTVCSAIDSVLIDEGTTLWYPCYNFFNDLLIKEGMPTSVENLYYLKDIAGTINYFIKIPILYSVMDEPITLFFMLISKPNYEVLGYPKLLLQQNNNTKRKPLPKNFAKYYEGKLLSSSGSFPYAFESVVYNNPDTEFSFFKSEGYDHLLYKSEDNLTIIVSYPTVHFFNILISFTYILIFFLLQVAIAIILTRNYVHIVEFNLTIKTRIVFYMVLILFFSLLVVGTGTVYYALNQFDERQYALLGDKSKSVLVELEHKLNDIHQLDDVSEEYLTSLLIKFSNVFYTDINLYNLQGDLIATSRDQIFNRKLMSKKMNAVAYRELVINKKAKIVQKERIGQLDYYSSYVPFMSNDNKLLAYLNLPYFSKEVVLRQEILKVVVAVINIYALLMIISIIIAIYLSNRVTAPLQMVQERFREIQIGKKNEIIEYFEKDEIGELVAEYNRMLSELAQSAELLAKSERESAWREMAKQIAHEIKNPLTPMKLSIQLLERSYNNNDDDFEGRLKNVSKTIIEQIDSLSSIATAFSQFARMPLVQVEKVNIVERVKQSVELFKNDSTISITANYPNNNEIFVNADNERILQVFNNLIKNAKQAIDDDTDGLITINFAEKTTHLIVEVKDNGSGIDPSMEDKLFQPNFTTKSSGAGLGLAIVKNIVEQFNGDIWFHSKPNEGTSFFISFPMNNG